MTHAEQLEHCIRILEEAMSDLQRSGNDITIREHKSKYPYIERTLKHQIARNQEVIDAFITGIAILTREK